MNLQTVSKRIKSKGSSLFVHSIFHTIQGEGPFSGVPAVFVRLGGCNLQCPGCDTEYTKGVGSLTISEIFEKIGEVAEGSKTDLVVITGGEPFRQNLEILVNQLHHNHIRVQIETNGSMAAQGEFKYPPVIVCSPKSAKLNPEMIPMIDHFKYVLDCMDMNPDDGLPVTALAHRATPHVARPPEGFKGNIYLQPMDMTEFYGDHKDLPDFSDESSDIIGSMDKAMEHYNNVHTHNKDNTTACVESAMYHGYTVQLQIHKILEME